MKISLLSLAVIMFCSCNAQKPAANSAPDEPVIRTASGMVRGVKEGDVDIFRGIPYAAPPVGEFRWRPPQPVASWEGVRDAKQFGPSCAQAGFGGGPGAISQGSSEDCLYLNVWRPAGARQGAKLPVMVWIHGGAFVGGSGNTSGNGFATKGVILVSINYRLGRLGHFAFPALSAEHPEEPKGSYAFMDQIAALKWVQQNIPVVRRRSQKCYNFRFLCGRRFNTFPHDHTISTWTVPEGNRSFKRWKGWCSDRQTDQQGKCISILSCFSRNDRNKLCPKTRDRGYRCSCSGNTSGPEG